MTGHNAHLLEPFIDLKQNFANLLLLGEVGRLQHFHDQIISLRELFFQNAAPHRQHRRADIGDILFRGYINGNIEPAKLIFQHLLQFQRSMFCGCELSEQAAAMRKQRQFFLRIIRHGKGKRQMHDAAARNRMIQHGHALGLTDLSLRPGRFFADLGNREHRECRKLLRCIGRLLPGLQAAVQRTVRLQLFGSPFSADGFQTRRLLLPHFLAAGMGRQRIEHRRTVLFDEQFQQKLLKLLFCKHLADRSKILCINKILHRIAAVEPAAHAVDAAIESLRFIRFEQTEFQPVCRGFQRTVIQAGFREFLRGFANQRQNLIRLAVRDIFRMDHQHCLCNGIIHGNIQLLCKPCGQYRTLDRCLIGAADHIEQNPDSDQPDTLLPAAEDSADGQAAFILRIFICCEFIILCRRSRLACLLGDDRQCIALLKLRKIGFNQREGFFDRHIAVEINTRI